MKFLVVDDSETMRRIIVGALQRIGFPESVEASGGREAIDRFDPSIGFVITDWNMPDMSGVELVRALRARGDGRSVPILMVTSRSLPEDIEAANAAGVTGHVLKPFTPQVLKGKIDEAIAGLQSAS